MPIRVSEYFQQDRAEFHMDYAEVFIFRRPFMGGFWIEVQRVYEN